MKSNFPKRREPVELESRMKAQNFCLNVFYSVKLKKNCGFTIKPLRGPKNQDFGGNSQKKGPNIFGFFRLATSVKILPEGRIIPNLMKIGAKMHLVEAFQRLRVLHA